MAKIEKLWEQEQYLVKFPPPLGNNFSYYWINKITV
jgi:hypothetical protein